MYVKEGYLLTLLRWEALLGELLKGKAESVIRCINPTSHKDQKLEVKDIQIQLLQPVSNKTSDCFVLVDPVIQIMIISASICSSK